MTDNLFQTTRKGEDSLYARIRDDKRGKPYRQRLEKMWIEYRAYAPKGFHKKLQFEFHQRWWEMYLTLGLYRLGFPVSTFSKDDHPDILLEFQDTKVWVEVVAPKPGTKGDAVPESVVNGVADLPMCECLLRLTQAVTDKRKRLNCYIQRGIVSKSDAFVVAVSACALNQFGSLLDWPQPVMLRVLAGAGNLAIPLSKSSEPYSKRQEAIARDSSSPVNLSLFYFDEFSSLVGVLYSNQDPLNAPIAPEESFEFFLNPNSKTRLKVPLVIIQSISTWSEDRTGEEEIVWKRTQPLGALKKRIDRMSVKLERAYQKELHKALEKCQFIEETLRMCIFSAVEIARLQLSPYFPVKYKPEDIGKLPLGALVSVFAKINNDTALHKSLRKITKERNDVAHRSLLFTLGELKDKDHMTEATLKMKGIVERATEVHNNVLGVRYALLRSLSQVKRSRGTANSGTKGSTP